MLGFWYTLTDILFPPPENVRLVRDVTRKKFGQRYQPIKLGKNLYALAHYDEALVRAAITANKFQHYTHAAKLLAGLFEQYLTELGGSEPIWLVPIPLSEKRKKERGYNQVEVILKQIRLENLKIEEMLKRNRDTVPQTSLKRGERLKNVVGAFSVRSHLPTPPPGTRVIIVDDVTTTGATLMAARAALAPHLPHPTKLTCVALAH